jgi:transposase-like protein
MAGRAAVLPNTLPREQPHKLLQLLVGHVHARRRSRSYAFPKEHWHRIRSTNGLERLHGEIKRRTNPIGAFPDQASALRVVTAVALNVAAIWTDRRYLDMSLLKSKEVVIAKAA